MILKQNFFITNRPFTLEDEELVDGAGNVLTDSASNPLVTDNKFVLIEEARFFLDYENGIRRVEGTHNLNL